jgi:hypothetical protein
LGKQFEHKDNGEAANKCRTLIWASLLQQENNPAATGNVNYYVDYN